jgi:hypothetical protein
MNQRQQQLIDELVKEFDRLNSSNLNRGSIIKVDAYMEEFNQAEMVKKETEAYNEAVRRVAEKLFLDQASLLQYDLHKLGIKSIVEDNSNKNEFHSKFIFYYNDYDRAYISLVREKRYIVIPNGEYIERTDKYVVTISSNGPKFDSLRDMAEDSDSFKHYVRKALQHVNKNI